MSEWLSASEVADITGISRQRVCIVAARENWRRKRVSGRGRPARYYRRDVRASGIAYGGSSPGDRRNTAFLQMVRWADKQRAWPSNEEIAAACIPPFKKPDMMSLLETRVFRGGSVLKGGREMDMRGTNKKRTGE